MTPVSTARRRTPYPCTAAVALGSFLVFLVQPIAARTLLPAFGGSGSVWVVSLVFYQVVLAAGTLLAHLLRTRLSRRGQASALAALAVAALGTALTALPPRPIPVWLDQPALRLLLSLTVSVGPSFLTLAVAGPLVQSWNAGVCGGRSSERGIYSLYALSNAASLIALATYSTLFEPRFGIHRQGSLWTGLFVVEVVLILILAARTHRAERPGPAADACADRDGGPGRRRTLAWGLRAAAGVMVLTSTSSLIGQEIAAIPLLWIVPLLLYLLTWIVAFAGRMRTGTKLQAGLVLAALTAILAAVDPAAHLALKMRLAGALAGLTLACLAIHAALYRSRPESRHLTGYYSAIAVGGAIGGLLAGVAAVQWIDDWRDVGLAYSLAALLAVADLLTEGRRPGGGPARRLISLSPACLLAVACLRLLAVTDMDRPGLVYKHRDFHGLVRVVELDAGRPDRHRLALYHGTTLHGMQRLTPQRRGEPTAYFGPGTGVDLAFRALCRRTGPAQGLHVGVVGLGAGTLAAYLRPPDAIRFYELNPTVARLAQSRHATGDPGRGFTFLDEAAGSVEVVVGDARLSLGAELAARPRGNGFDLLVLDAFAGDAVPMHLLTREAFSLYERHLAGGGILAVHVSSNWLDLVPLLYTWAGAESWEALTVSTRGTSDGIGCAHAVWVVMMRHESTLRGLARQCMPLMDAGRIMVQNRRNVTCGDLQPWTDERGDLVALLRTRIRPRRM